VPQGWRMDLVDEASGYSGPGLSCCSARAESVCKRSYVDDYAGACQRP